MNVFLKVNSLNLTFAVFCWEISLTVAETAFYVIKVFLCSFSAKKKKISKFLGITAENDF